MRYSAGAATGILTVGGNGAGNTNNQLSSPNGIYFDSTSNSLVIANTGGNNIVHWVITQPTWTLLAGNSDGTAGTSSTALSAPIGVTLDSVGNMYVADTGNHRIQLFKVGQTNGITIAGVTGTLGNTVFLLNKPSAVRLDSQGNLYVADTKNNRIQKFTCI
ncbi:unnamed protein product [Rotaria sp. Silwood2]|nr:unnamed protein product [Rotaria sp. Silwood2]CAF3129229.1 unnamed protein product [Rotaria sp. Silwood2]CAF3924334.1 unnamed protein product [Rotaria sp. Silwood2]CAF4237959.1 unnamed protein product [Rotaria sp. Silwood2]